MASHKPLATNVGFSRRMLLRAAAAVTISFPPASILRAEPRVRTMPVTGHDNPNLRPFDKLLSSFVKEHKLPGAALGVTRNGKLVYSRGFGYADLENDEPVQPAALFRIASVTKPFTSAAIMQLVEQGALSLDDHVFDFLKFQPPAGATLDERWHQITIRHCLHHTGGWDRDKSFDPIVRPWEIIKTLGTRPPVSPTDIIRYMMGQPLDFDPGKRSSYSNLGYLILGRVLEKVTRQSYQSYVKNQVLAPLGIRSMHLGRALLEKRAEGEVKYYDRNSSKGPCLYPPLTGKQVPMQYGGDNFEGYEAHGGWIASTVELVRFASAFDDPDACPLLKASSIGRMWGRPRGLAGYENDHTPRAAYYACGWMVRPIEKPNKLNTWHNGYICGTESLLVRRYDGLCWAVLFNSAKTPKGESLTDLIDAPLHDAANAVQTWPDYDQFKTLLS